MSQSFTIRLPDEIYQYIEDTAKDQGVKKSQVVINILQDKMQNNGNRDVRQVQDNPPLLEQDSPHKQDQVQSTLQGSLDRLVDVVAAATQQQQLLTEQLQLLTTRPGAALLQPAQPQQEQPGKPPTPTKKASKLTSTKQKRVYLYKGRKEELRKHLKRELPHLPEDEIDKSRKNITQALRRGKGQLTPEEAISYEIERMQAEQQDN